MKKLFSLFSMLIMLSSNVLPAFTYADSWDNELAIQILTEEVNNVWESFSNENNVGFTQGNDSLNTFWNTEYTVTFNLNWWYWTEEWTESTNEKSKTYELGNQWILTNWRTPSKLDLCSDWVNTNMKCMFDWWYLEEEWITRWTWYVSKDMKVYARWLPFEDREVVFNDGSKIIIMDRNIWAITWNREDTGSYWYHFQWWNNYWFKLKWDNGESFPNWETIWESSVENSIPDNASTYYYSSWRSIRRSNYHSNIWWWYPSSNPDTLKQWPCPKWYHVPEIEEWRSLINLMGSNVRWSDINNILNLPSPWYTYSSTSINGLGTSAWYWVVTPAWLNQIYEMFIYKNWWYTYEYASTPIYGMSIRCFKDFQRKEIVFHSNWWTEIVTLYETTSDRETPQKLPIPEKDYSVFEWRYTTSGFNENSRVLTTNIPVKSTWTTVELYAKWSCDFWYEISEDWQLCTPISVNFIANWWRYWDEDINYVSSQINYELSNAIRYSHTNNIDDDWNANNTSYWTSIKTNDVVKINWAENIHVELKYSTEENYDYLYVFKWVYSDTPKAKLEDWQLYTFHWWNSNTALNTTGFDVEWDTVTFSFYSDTSSNYYWYYATITWIEKIPYVIYPENSFSNIPEPTRENSIFKWWYFDNLNFQNEFNESNVTTWESMYVYAKWECESWFSLSEDLNSCNPNIWTLNSNDWKWNEINIYRYVTNNTFINNWYEFIGWNTQSDWNWTTYKSWDIINESWLVLYAQWKSLEEKTEETTTENVVYTNTTTVTVWDETTEETLSWSSTLRLVSKEVEDTEVKKEEDTTKVQDSEIKVTSDKTVEYEWWLEVYLEKTENAEMEKLTWTIKFSAPVAVKIPIISDAEYVKVQVKHGDEDFGFKWLTLNPVNECNNWEAANDKYNWEDVLVTWNTNKYATIYTCSASTFVAYTENNKPVENITTSSAAAWGWRTIATKQETKITEQEHNSADTVEPEVTQTSNQSANTSVIKGQVKKIEWRALTRWEVAIMTNILLEVYPQLVEWKQELDDVTNACSNYADEQSFTKDEKKAITRLCKLSIMWIHNDTNKPLEEFLVNDKSTNDEFSKVINRSVETYNEKDLSTIKDALKKLEWDEESVVFGTVYGVFMGIKNILS